jgi:hypothetical protein
MNQLLNRQMKLGVYVFGIASIAPGVLNLVWGEFEPAHQPIQAISDHIPGVKILACIAALWLIAGGAAIIWPRTARAGSAALAIIDSVFAAFSLPRFYTAPHFLGYHASVFIGVFASVAQQLILVVAAAIVCALFSGRDVLSPGAARIVRWIFGICCVDFGVAHLTSVQSVGLLVPRWIPFGGSFWAALTGVAFLLAGLAIFSGILDGLAARLLALMLLIFGVLVLAPMIFAYPHNHMSWGGNAYNLAAVGAAWIFADWLAFRNRMVPIRRRA